MSSSAEEEGAAPSREALLDADVAPAAIAAIPPVPAIDAATFFGEAPPEASARLEGRELGRAYWRTRALKAELERKERYWANICDALSVAYADLERTTRELGEARAELARLNADLERRVDAQVSEIREHAAQIERLNLHLSKQVEERSAELLAFARELGSRMARIDRGTVLNGRTRLGEPIGEGGAGVVYHAIDEVLGDRLAIKVLRRPYDREATVRFLGEAAAATKVPHPAVVRPLHLDVSEEGLPYILMERVDGHSLRGQLATFGVLSFASLARFGAVLAEVLGAAHANGLVHRDVKPGNLMITRASPGLRVLDFGLSKALDTPPELGLTLAGRIMGTPAYIAPEQIVDPARAGPPADVYSSGVTLFELCAGRVPFACDTLSELSRAHLSIPPPDLRSLRPETPDDLAELVTAMLEKEPTRRPTAATLVATLAALADALGAGPAHVEAARLLDGAADFSTQTR